MNITIKIKKIREAKGYSQEYMAKKLGIAQSTYCKMEKNARLINFENIVGLAGVLETEIVEIIKEV